VCEGGRRSLLRREAPLGHPRCTNPELGRAAISTSWCACGFCLSSGMGAIPPYQLRSTREDGPHPVYA
jgi:hypothetical protein